MEIKLNNKQKEMVMDFLCEDKGIGELGKFFYTYDKKEIMCMEISINDNVGSNWKNWWNLVVNGEIRTQLNFDYYKKVLKKLQALG